MLASIPLVTNDHIIKRKSSIMTPRSIRAEETAAAAATPSIESVASGWAWNGMEKTSYLMIAQLG
jgi:hypothetical protein